MTDMLGQNLQPFNIELLVLNDKTLKTLREVKSMAIFVPQSKNFDPDGLFSTEIFGKVGTEMRNETFGYINLKMSVFHPIIFKAICDLKSLYKKIMMGTGFAIWDSKLKDFVPASVADGETGYSFFLKHFKEIKFEERPSTKRDFNIRLVYKYLENGMYSHLLVLPAGMRDYKIDDSGKPSEDDVNGFYRKVLAVANVIDPITVKNNPEVLDNTRYKLQLAVNEVFNYFQSMIDGKSKFIESKFAKRAIFYGTRNVITAVPFKPKSKNAPDLIKFNDTVVGLYQYMKAIMYITTFRIRNGFIAQTFSQGDTVARVTDPKTLTMVERNVSPSASDAWLSYDGIEQTVNKFANDSIRRIPIKIEDYYLGLIYRGPDKTFKVFRDINELPSDRSKDDVKPITYAEFFYYTMYPIVHDYPGILTRYPVTGLGSVYPTDIYLKTTEKGISLVELDDSWNPTDKVAPEFPLLSKNFFTSMSPHYTHLEKLGADFDGDQCSLTIFVSNQVKKELKDMMNSREYYIGPDGKLAFSAHTSTLELVLNTITG